MTLPMPNGKEIRIGNETVHRLIWHLGQLIVTIFLAGVVWARLEYRVDTNAQAIASTTSAMLDMDKNGTRRSHETDTNQQTQIDEINRRLANVEGVVRDLVPKVERIDANVLTLIAREKSK